MQIGKSFPRRTTHTQPANAAQIHRMCYRLLLLTLQLHGIISTSSAQRRNNCFKEPLNCTRTGEESGRCELQQQLNNKCSQGLIPTRWKSHHERWRWKLYEDQNTSAFGPPHQKALGTFQHAFFVFLQPHFFCTRYICASWNKKTGACFPLNTDSVSCLHSDKGFFLWETYMSNKISYEIHIFATQ